MRMKRIRWTLIAAMLLACVPAEQGNKGGGSLGDETVTADTGVALVDIDVASGDDALHLVAQRSSGGLLIPYLEDPDGNVVLNYEDWYGSDESASLCFYYGDSVSVMNYPILDGDEPLSAGTWRATVWTLTDQGYLDKGAKVGLSTRTRGSNGRTLKVNLVYAEGLDADSEITDAVASAIARWEDIYDSAGIVLEVTELSSTVDPDLGEPIAGDSAYANLYERGSLLMVIGETVGGAADLYGESGGIPGAFVATDYSAVAISWLVHAGANGKFNSEETRILGETMAHESGHFIGLFHPVEIDWTYFDAMDDTPRCSSQRECESDLGDNLMFPYPVCGNACDPQEELTDEQSVVMNNYVGVQ
jgi:hypothetical protein